MPVLFAEYRTAPTPELRRELWQQNIGLARHIAHKMHKSLQMRVELDDLIQTAMLALRRAIEGYDPERGWKFSTFCARCIRNEIFDFLQRQRWSCKPIRKWLRLVKRARDELQMASGERASEQEIADHLRLDVEVVWEVESRKMMKVLPKEREKDDGIAGVATVEADTSPEYGDWREVAERVLDEREWRVLVMIYWEGALLAEVGITLKVSRERVRQIKNAALDKLRAATGDEAAIPPSIRREMCGCIKNLRAGEGTGVESHKGLL